ncbi:MAG: aminotransferase class V-fold PLP-dependent enzyme [Pirellulales bacterium]|nr:aminotransferase class V-fold PLP-dependent enzyme [Pirellulales bacterium]
MMSPEPTFAIDGGSPAFPDGPPGWPPLDEDIAEVLARAATDGSWGRYHAEHSEALRRELARMIGRRHVALVSSGTIAVELALRGLNVGPGNEVIVAAYDFSGNFRAIEAVGAMPVLADIRADTWCVDEAKFEAAMSSATKAVIVSHLHGGLADMHAINGIAKAKGIAIVEDICQSPGAVVSGRAAGQWGDVSVMSFGGSKLLTAGRGGAVLTDDEQVLQRIKVFANRGNDAFPLSELQAAVLLPQMAKLASRNSLRLSNARHLLAGLADVEQLRLVRIEDNDQPALYKVAMRYEPAIENSSAREEFINTMHAEGIAIDAGFRGFAGRSARRCRKSGSPENAVAAAEATVLLHHPILLEESAVIDRLVGAIRRVVSHLADGTRQ